MHDYNVLKTGAPLEEATHAIILLHGRGASAQSIVGLADEFRDGGALRRGKARARIYVAAPQATNHTWYPFSFMADEAQNEPWLSGAVSVVRRLVDETQAHVPVENIYLMGFSQGACLALEVAARVAQPYGGVAAFSGGVIGKEIARERYGGDFGGAKVYIGNSDADPHVPLSRSEESRDILEELGASVTLDVYPGMPHTIIPAEIEAVRGLMFG